MDYKDPREFKALKNKELLDKIAMIESSGGRDLAHATLQTGMHKGEAGIGDYGLMPNTLVDIQKRFPSDTTEGLSKEELALKAEQDPEFAKTMAASLVSHLKDKKGLSDEETVAAWESGHNLPKERIQPLLDTARARKFRVLNAQK